MPTPALLLALLPCSAPVAAPVDGAASEAADRPGATRPTCGLGAEFHAGRRAELRRRLERGVVVVLGLPETRGYVEFEQDKTFWYLTGVASPDAALVMDLDAGAEILFLPPPSPRRERWDGELWDAGDDWVRALTGFDDVRRSTELVEAVEALAAERGQLWISMHPEVARMDGFDRARPHDQRRARHPLDGRPSRAEALRDRLEERTGLRADDLAPALADMRRVKTPEEVAAMARAGRAGALAMAEGIRSTRPGVGEWELDALMTYFQVRHGASGPAYHAIVGSGPNSLVLHYSESSRRVRAGDVVLVDFGAEVDHYATDITRTWPADGTFTPRQAELYDAVLAAQEAGIAAVRPGVTMGQVAAACQEVFRERGMGHLVRHGPCHYIGLEVHDVGAGDAPLEPGVCFTVEPGLYEEETGIGVRIEDVVVVTADGCEVLTADVPKAREAVEALVGETGVVDWLEGGAPRTVAPPPDRD